MHYVYIIYSRAIDQYYIGGTTDINERHHQHNVGYFKGSFTSKANDWEIVLKLNFNNISDAKKAEIFIKNMKSRKFIEKLLGDSEWLLNRFNK